MSSKYNEVGVKIYEWLREQNFNVNQSIIMTDLILEMVDKTGMELVVKKK